jgi:glycosyltransferase involved in cell wall biosynthesis
MIRQAISSNLALDSAVQAPATLADPRLNILILNTHLPIFPGGGGVEYLTTKYMAGLANQVGLVSMVHTRDALNKAQGLIDAGANLYLWHSPHLDTPPAPAAYPRSVRRLHQWLETLLEMYQAGLWRPTDTLIIDRCFRNMSPPLTAALTEHPWQALSVIESSAAALVDYLPRQIVSILVMHDIRSVMYSRRAQASSSLWERLRYRLQARRYFAFERKYSRRYDLVVTVSQHDADWVREHYRPRRVITVPLPVDTQYFQPIPAMAEQPARIVFTGLMNHPPNADAAVFFARQVFPRVRLALPQAEFYIVGRHPTAEVQALSHLPGVYVTGEVDDIRLFLASATVVVVPLRYGSGARQKILEAWSMERCVVSTTIGAEGLEYQDGVNLAIADADTQMADTVIRALGEPDFRDRLRHAGRMVALDAHHPQRIASNYYHEIQTALREKIQHDVPMRVALDMRWMTPGMAGGLENLARAFMQHLISLDRYNAYTAILPACTSYDFDLRGHDNIRIVTRDSVSTLLQRARRRISRAIHSRLRLDHWESPEVVNLRFARSLDAEIVYSFPGYIFPDVYPLRHVLMVPDIQHEFFPEFFSEQALEERRRLYGDSIRRADHICAISEFTRQTLIDRLGVAPDKITAIPLAADPIFNTDADPQADAATLRKYGLQPGSYLFFPAHTWHHKNHRTAIDALRILREKYGLTPTLVCTGGAREAQPALEQQIAEYGLQHQVRFLGYCPHDDLPALYRGAACLIFASLFEGFGMPVLEAMACGCPVICSNTSSLPEIAGDAALLVDPFDSAAFAAAAARLLCNADLRADMRARGLPQAARFSWQRHTHETVAVFYRVHRQIREL